MKTNQPLKRMLAHRICPINLGSYYYYAQRSWGEAVRGTLHVLFCLIKKLEIDGINSRFLDVEIKA